MEKVLLTPEDFSVSFSEQLSQLFEVFLNLHNLAVLHVECNTLFSKLKEHMHQEALGK